MKITRFLLFVLAMVITGAASVYFYSGGTALLSTDKPKKADKFEVLLTVANDLKSIEIAAPGCTANTKGCFKISKRNSGQVKFTFDAPDNGWQLTEFKICKGDEKLNLDCNLDLWERLEFFVVKDLASSDIYPMDNKGVIHLEQLPAGDVSFFLLDQNAIKKDYFYSVQACNPDANPECILADPPIVNEGRN